MRTSIDFIGDIHGHFDKLHALLKKLGYAETRGAFRYPGNARSVVFLGDYVDRGPQIRETLKLVRSMCEAGSATALMGNHEFNMLGYWYRNGDGGRFLRKTGEGFLREHSQKNVAVHARTVAEFAGHADELKSVLEFLRGLPFYLETDSFRALHACFDLAAIDALKCAGIRSFADGNFDELIYRVYDEDNEYGDSLFHPVDQILKGPEMEMPPGTFFIDKDGRRRVRTRVRWWVNPASANLGELSMQPLDDEVGASAVPEAVRTRAFYGEHERPVFFGHYWYSGKPRLQRDNVCCLDFSVAKPEDDGGRLASYRFYGEQCLDARRFEWIGR